jgi:hypothetical protein
MQHLDDGVLHALVDGEVTSADLPPIRAHLETCADCTARLEAARLLAGEAAELVDAVEFPERDRAPALRPMRRGGTPLARRLAWAASVALAASLGYAGGRAGPNEPATPADIALVSPPPPPAAGEPVSPEPRQVQSAPSPTPQPQAPPLSRSPLAGDTRAASAAPEAEPAPKTQMAAAENEAAAVRDLAPPTAVGGVNAPAAAGRGVAEEKAADSKLAFRREAASPARQAPLMFEEVTLAEAVRRLGGTLRQVEGLVPVRLEAAGLTVHIVYRLSEGELVLEQRRQGDSVAVRLLAPGLSPDSLARLRVRE